MLQICKFFDDNIIVYVLHRLPSAPPDFIVVLHRLPSAPPDCIAEIASEKNYVILGD